MGGLSDWQTPARRRVAALPPDKVHALEQLVTAIRQDLAAQGVTRLDGDLAIAFLLGGRSAFNSSLEHFARCTCLGRRVAQLEEIATAMRDAWTPGGPR